jgi:hypothetical protein
MYSHLNVFVNEINAIGVKDITDLNINRKILQSLRKPDYDLVKAIIYEKKLEDLKPSHISWHMSFNSCPSQRRRPKNHPPQLQAMLSQANKRKC